MIFFTSFIKCRLQYENTKCPIKVFVYFQIPEYFTWKHQISSNEKHVVFYFMNQGSCIVNKVSV